MTRRRLIAIAIVVAAGTLGSRHVLAASGYVQIFSNWLLSETPEIYTSVKTVKFVNANGAVAGAVSTLGSPVVRAFVWTLTDGYVDPGTLGASSATLVGFNDNRMAAGNSALVDGGPTRAFSWTKSSGIVDLGTLGGSSAEATSINNSGWIVGRSTFDDRFPTETRPFLWTPSGGMSALPTSGCQFYSTFFQNGATRVSDSGIVVGYKYDGVYNINGGGVYHAAVWDTTANMCTALFGSVDDPRRGNYSIADLVTNSGWVAGRISFPRDGIDPDPSFQRTAGFVWSAATGVRDAHSRVTDLNEDGWATAVDEAGHGFVLRPGQSDEDLGPIVTDLPFFVLDNHLVVGHSFDESDFILRAFYWDPQTGRHELDVPTESDYTIVFNHSGDRFVGLKYSGDDFGVNEIQPFVWDGTVKTLTNGPLSSVLSHRSLQIGSTGFIAAQLNDPGGLGTLAKVWAPPLSFGFTGFLPPNNKPYPQFNDVKAGSKVRVKFDFGGDPGAEVLAWGYPRLVEVNCTTGALPIADTSEPGPNFPQAPPVMFQKGPDRYTFEWNTDPSLTNTCRGVMFKFIDGSGGHLLFKLK